MTFKALLAAAALGLTLSGTSTATCTQVQKITGNQEAANRMAYQQFAPPIGNQDASSAAYYQFERNRNSTGDNHGANSVVACK